MGKEYACVVYLPIDQTWDEYRTDHISRHISDTELEGLTLAIKKSQLIEGVADGDVIDFEIHPSSDCEDTNEGNLIVEIGDQVVSIELRSPFN